MYYARPISTLLTFVTTSSPSFPLLFLSPFFPFPFLPFLSSFPSFPFLLFLSSFPSFLLFLSLLSSPFLSFFIFCGASPKKCRQRDLFGAVTRCHAFWTMRDNAIFGGVFRRHEGFQKLIAGTGQKRGSQSCLK